MNVPRVVFVLVIVNHSIFVDASTVTVAAVAPILPVVDSVKKREVSHSSRLPALTQSDHETSRSSDVSRKIGKADKMKVLINLAMQKEEAAFTRLFGKLSDDDKKILQTRNFVYRHITLKIGIYFMLQVKRVGWAW